MGAAKGASRASEAAERALPRAGRLSAQEKAKEPLLRNSAETRISRPGFASGHLDEPEWPS